MKMKLLALLGFSFLVYLMWAADSGHLPDLAISIYDIPNGDKAGHFILYGLLALILTLAFPKTWQAGRIPIPVFMVFFLVFAVGEEWSQSLFPRRTADVVDGVCSCLGILAGTWAAYYRMKKSDERRH